MQATSTALGLTSFNAFSNSELALAISSSSLSIFRRQSLSPPEFKR